MEDVDSLLNTGEVPNLFAVDEKAELNEVPLVICLFYKKLKGSFAPPGLKDLN